MANVNLAEIKFGGAVGDRQTAKLNFPAIRYIHVADHTFLCIMYISNAFVHHCI